MLQERNAFRGGPAQRTGPAIRRATGLLRTDNRVRRSVRFTLDGNRAELVDGSVREPDHETLLVRHDQTDERVRNRVVFHVPSRGESEHAKRSEAVKERCPQPHILEGVKVTENVKPNDEALRIA